MRDCHSSDDKDVIAINGKTLRHSYDKSRRRGAIHVISAFSTMHSLVLGQIKTDEKSNEITAIPEMRTETIWRQSLRGAGGCNLALGTQTYFSIPVTEPGEPPQPLLPFHDY